MSLIETRPIRPKISQSQPRLPDGGEAADAEAEEPRSDDSEESPDTTASPIKASQLDSGALDEKRDGHQGAELCDGASDEDSDGHLTHMVQLGIEMLNNDEEEDSFDTPVQVKAKKDASRPDASRSLYLSRPSVRTAVDMPDTEGDRPKGTAKSHDLEKKIARLTAENTRLQKQLHSCTRFPLQKPTKQQPPPAPRGTKVGSPSRVEGTSLRDLERIRVRQQLAESKHALADKHKQDVMVMQSQLKEAKEAALRREGAHLIVVERLKRASSEMQASLAEAEARAKAAEERAASIHTAQSSPSEGGDKEAPSGQQCGQTGSVRKRGGVATDGEAPEVRRRGAVADSTLEVPGRLPLMRKRGAVAATVADQRAQGQTPSHLSVEVTSRLTRGGGSDADQGRVPALEAMGVEAVGGTHMRLGDEEAAEALSPKAPLSVEEEGNKEKHRMYQVGTGCEECERLRERLMWAQAEAQEFKDLYNKALLEGNKGKGAGAGRGAGETGHVCKDEVSDSTDMSRVGCMTKSSEQVGEDWGGFGAEGRGGLAVRETGVSGGDQGGSLVADFPLRVRDVSRIPDTIRIPLLPEEETGSGIGEKKARVLPGGAVEEMARDGGKWVTFPNGTVKEMTTDGRVVVRFTNGDIKEECGDGTVTYFYREAKTTEICYPNGLILTHFPDNQMEKAHPDGSRDIVFPNGQRVKFRSDGTNMRVAH